MDLLFSRYADPFLFLDHLLDCGQFTEGLYEINELSQNDKLWELYLSCRDGWLGEGGVYHFFPPSSFKDWKATALSKDERTTEMAEDEVDVEATIELAQDILRNFNPLGEDVET